MNPYGGGGVIERTRTTEGGEEREGMGKIIGRQFPGQKSKRERGGGVGSGNRATFTQCGTCATYTNMPQHTTGRFREYCTKRVPNKRSITEPRKKFRTLRGQSVWSDVVVVATVSSGCGSGKISGVGREADERAGPSFLPPGAGGLFMAVQQVWEVAHFIASFILVSQLPKSF